MPKQDAFYLTQTLRQAAMFFSRFLKIVMVVGVLLFLSGCASLEAIPGLDRLKHHFSKAEVGPVLDQRGEIVPGTEPEHIVESKTSAADLTASSVPPASVVKPAPVAKVSEPEVPNTQAFESEIVEVQEKVAQPQRPDLSVDAPADAPIVTPVLSVLEAANKQQSPLAKLSGNVQVVVKSGSAAAEGIVARLKRADGKPIHVRAEGQSVSHSMDMEKKIYKPGHMVIRKGDSLNFINKDAIQHNVFSSSGTNAFDLGTYGSGLQRTVRLNDEGIVKIYCNIHPKMAAFVAVDDVGESTLVDPQSGFFEFNHLPPSKYLLTIWSIRGEQQHVVDLSEVHTSHLDLSFDLSGEEEIKHLNKFGKQYKRASVRREFY